MQRKYIRSQIRYVKDIKMYSIILFLSLGLTFLFSFYLQEIYSSNRQLGRDIHTQQYDMSQALFSMMTLVTLLRVHGQNYQQLVMLQMQVTTFVQNHTYLQVNSLEEKGLEHFLSQDDAYSLLTADVYSIESSTIIDDEQFTTFLNESIVYEAMLSDVYSEYTTLLANNNATSERIAGFGLFFEMIFSALILFGLFLPAVRRLFKNTETIENDQKKIEESNNLFNAASKRSDIAYDLPLDVVCIGRNTYSVSFQGETINVVYDEEKQQFYCVCDMFKRNRACFHIQRAQWLRSRIFL